MSSDAWPSPDSPPPALPRIEDLPIADQGYDQEAVRVAFDSFYRHAAQLDSSLRALEAVEVFRRDADALRNDLRALREVGLGGGADLGWATPAYERARPEVPAVVFRLGAEAALIVAVAVIAGVAHFRAAVIVALMAAAFVVVAVCEWLASRARFVPPALAFLPAPEEQDERSEPAPYVEAPAPAPAASWGAPALGPTPEPGVEPAEDTEPDALTMVEPAGDAPVGDAPGDALVAEEAVPDPWEVHAAADEPEPEAELAERGGFFRRRRH